MHTLKCYFLFKLDELKLISEKIYLRFSTSSYLAREMNSYRFSTRPTR